MINWLNQEDGVCEGSFKSNFFRDDEMKNLNCLLLIVRLVS